MQCIRVYMERTSTDEQYVPRQRGMEIVCIRL